MPDAGEDAGTLADGPGGTNLHHHLNAGHHLASLRSVPTSPRFAPGQLSGGPAAPGGGPATSGGTPPVRLPVELGGGAMARSGPAGMLGMGMLDLGGLSAGSDVTGSASPQVSRGRPRSIACAWLACRCAARRGETSDTLGSWAPAPPRNDANPARTHTRTASSLLSERVTAPVGPRARLSLTVCCGGVSIAVLPRSSVPTWCTTTSCTAARPRPAAWPAPRPCTAHRRCRAAARRRRRRRRRPTACCCTSAPRRASPAASATRPRPCSRPAAACRTSPRRRRTARRRRRRRQPTRRWPPSSRRTRRRATACPPTAAAATCTWAACP